MKTLVAFLIYSGEIEQMKKLLIFLLIGVVLVSGCAQQQPRNEIYIRSHGNQIYTFANDIGEALRVKTNDPQGIKDIGKTLEKLNIVFNGSDVQDNAYFRVVLVNIGAKVPTYYSYEGRLVYFDSYYFVDDKWFNSTNEETAPSFSGPVLWLKGPATGANETSLVLMNNTIYLSGDSYKGLTLAGDKLVLLLFGIDKTD